MPRITLNGGHHDRWDLTPTGQPPDTLRIDDDLYRLQRDDNGAPVQWRGVWQYRWIVPQTPPDPRAYTMRVAP